MRMSFVAAAAASAGVGNVVFVVLVLFKIKVCTPLQQRQPYYHLSR